MDASAKGEICTTVNIATGQFIAKLICYFSVSSVPLLLLFRTILLRQQTINDELRGLLGAYGTKFQLNFA